MDKQIDEIALDRLFQIVGTWDIFVSWMNTAHKTWKISTRLLIHEDMIIQSCQAHIMDMASVQISKNIEDRMRDDKQYGYSKYKQINTIAPSGNIQSFNVPTEESVAIYWKSSTSAALCSLPGQPTANVFKICSPHVTPRIFQMNARFQGLQDCLG